jgi:hypothetical protein
LIHVAWILVEREIDMRIRSHLDPTLFVIFLHIDARKYDEEFIALGRSLKRAKGTDIDSLMEALRGRERRTMAHERYHFWQGLRLPFLHLYAILTLRAAFVGVKALARATKDWGRWAELGGTIDGFDRLDSLFHVAGNRSGQLVFGRKRLSEYEFTLEFSAKEMLECAASIFDYQTSCENHYDMSDPLLFELWRKRNPAYLKIFEFLKNFLGSDRLSLRTILPLINPAFHTSCPERALIELTARIWGRFAQPTSMNNPFLAQMSRAAGPNFSADG